MLEVQETDYGLAWLRLNRPQQRNALSIALMNGLTDSLTQLADDGHTRVVVLRAAGPVFCAGLDLAEASDPQRVEASAEAMARLLQRLRASPLITIAAVHGGAYAGGGGLLAACDMAIGTRDLKIGFPEARRGLLPALISDVLKTKIRHGDLSYLFLAGETIEAERALQIGLLQQLVEPDQLSVAAEELAEAILAGGPETIRATKRLLHQAYASNTDQRASNHHTIEEHLRARRSAEAAEGLRAFLEKRAPAWQREPQARRPDT
jgi:methylglutaconyl-CoA hydratase